MTNLEEGIELTESIDGALRVLRFTTHTGLKRTPFELHYRRKSRTEPTNMVKDGKTYLSDWSGISILASNKPKFPTYVGRDADDEITNLTVMTRTKNEERQANEGPKSTKKKNLVSYPLKLKRQIITKNN